MSRRVHDAVARGYDSAGGIIGAKNGVFAEAVAGRWGGRARPLRVVDLGVGDGAALASLAGLDIALEMTGVDVSVAMLRRASERVRLRTVHAPAQDALRHLPARVADLVVAHFILAYVPCEAVARQAAGLLAPGGVLSLATTTEEGGAPFHERLDRHFLSSRNPARRHIGRLAQRGLALSHVPKRWEDLARCLADAGLAVLSRRTLRLPVVFRDASEAYRFGIEEGWAANFLAGSGLPLPVAKAVAWAGLRLCDYPFEVTQVIEIVEAGRPGEHGIEAAGAGFALAAD
jgi:SAM-dependent methyltransferase